MSTTKEELETMDDICLSIIQKVVLKPKRIFIGYEKLENGEYGKYPTTTPKVEIEWSET